MTAIPFTGYKRLTPVMRALVDSIVKAGYNVYPEWHQYASSSRYAPDRLYVRWTGATAYTVYVTATGGFEAVDDRYGNEIARSVRKCRRVMALPS